MHQYKICDHWDQAWWNTDIVQHQTSQEWCPTYGKTCKCRKVNHFRSVCRSVPKAGRQGTQRGKIVHKVQKGDKENWQNSDDNIDKHIEMVRIRSFSSDSIITNLKTRSKKNKIYQLLRIQDLTDIWTKGRGLYILFLSLPLLLAYVNPFCWSKKSVKSWICKIWWSSYDRNEKHLLYC